MKKSGYGNVLFVRHGAQSTEKFERCPEDFGDSLDGSANLAETSHAYCPVSRQSYSK